MDIMDLVDENTENPVIFWIEIRIRGGVAQDKLSGAAPNISDFGFRTSDFFDLSVFPRNL